MESIDVSSAVRAACADAELDMLMFAVSTPNDVARKSPSEMEIRSLVVLKIPTCTSIDVCDPSDRDTPLKFVTEEIRLISSANCVYSS